MLSDEEERDMVVRRLMGMLQDEAQASPQAPANEP